MPEVKEYNAMTLKVLPGTGKACRERVYLPVCVSVWEEIMFFFSSLA